MKLCLPSDSPICVQASTKEGSVLMPQNPHDGFDEGFAEEPYEPDSNMLDDFEEHNAYLANNASDPARRALMRGGDSETGVAPYGAAPETTPLLIPGTGISMGTAFLKRRQRPLTMRLAIVTILACLLISGLI